MEKDIRHPVPSRAREGMRDHDVQPEDVPVPEFWGPSGPEGYVCEPVLALGRIRVRSGEGLFDAPGRCPATEIQRPDRAHLRGGRRQFSDPPPPGEHEFPNAHRRSSCLRAAPLHGAPDSLPSRAGRDGFHPRLEVPGRKQMSGPVQSASSGGIEPALPAPAAPLAGCSDPAGTGQQTLVPQGRRRTGQAWGEEDPREDTVNTTVRTSEGKAKSVLPSGVRTTAKKALRAYGMMTGLWRSLPDFLIIGAKRGGTTSLYNYLLEHPRVTPLFPSIENIKGIHFCDRNFDRGVTWYRSHFPSVAYKASMERMKRRRTIAGEASPYYL